MNACSNTVHSYSQFCISINAPKSRKCLCIKTQLLANLIVLAFILVAQVNPANAGDAQAKSLELQIGVHGPRLRSDNVTPIKEAQLPRAKFRKVAKSGKLLSDKASIWSCVYDASTGLTWEVKTQDHTLHDKGFEFRWGGRGTSAFALGKYLGRNQREPVTTENASTLRFGDWNHLIELSVRDKFCGYDDWRVPDLGELASIVKCEVGAHDLDLGCTKTASDGPTIDLKYFPNTNTEAYWSSSLSSFNSGARNHAWAVHFTNGSDLPKYGGTYLLLRLVRGPN